MFFQVLHDLFENEKNCVFGEKVAPKILETLVENSQLDFKAHSLIVVAVQQDRCLENVMEVALLLFCELVGISEEMEQLALVELHSQEVHYRLCTFAVLKYPALPSLGNLQPGFFLERSLAEVYLGMLYIQSW